MRSPAANFDMRAALKAEIAAADEALRGAAQNPQALHQCRVRLKRARALARVSAVCAPGLSAVFQGAARDAMHALSQARDLEVMAGNAQTFAQSHKGKTKAALRAFAEAIERARAAAAAPDIARARAALQDLAALTQVWPEVSARQIEKGARRIVRRARKAYRNGRAQREEELRHRWRRREKDRLYAGQLLGPAWPNRCKRRGDISDRLGGVLGRERDILLLRARLAAEPGLAGDFDAAARALGALDQRRAKLAKRADKLGARLHRGGA